MEHRKVELPQDVSISDATTHDLEIEPKSRNTKPLTNPKKAKGKRSKNSGLAEKKSIQLNDHDSKSHFLNAASYKNQQPRDHQIKTKNSSKIEAKPNQEVIDTLVRCFLTLNKDRIIQELDRAFSIDNMIHLRISAKTRYLSRRFELPPFLLQPILRDLKNPEIDLKIRINLAQAVKYGVRNGLDITYEDLLELLEEDSPDIKSEIAWALGYKVKNSGKDLTSELIKKIKSKVYGDVDSGAKAFLKNEIAKYDSPKNEQFWQVNNNSIGILSKNSKKPQTIVTKNQQVTKSKYRSTGSHESHLEIANILEDIKSQRIKRQINLKAGTEPEAKKESKGSQQSWYRGTYTNAKNLYNRARGNFIITDEDKDEYLTKKFLTGKKYQTGGLLGNLITDRMIAATFYEISKKQKLAHGTIDKLMLCLDDPRSVACYYCPDGVTDTLVRKMINSWVPEYPSEIEKNISIGMKSIKQSKIVSCENIKNAWRLFFDEIDLMRRDTILAISNCVLRNGFELSPKFLKKIESCLEDKDKKVKSCAVRILWYYNGSQEIDYAKIFNACLSQLEEGIELQESTDFLDQQSRDPKRCKELFTEKVILRLTNLSRNSAHNYQVRIDCIEILNNYLEHRLTKGFPLLALENIKLILQERSLNDQERMNNLKERALISILLSAEKESNLPHSIVAFLVENFNNLDKNFGIGNFIIMILVTICDQADIPSIQEVSSKLQDDRVVIGQGSTITFEPPTGSNSYSPTISALTGKIILSFLKKGNMASSEVMDRLAEALKSNDKQTKIQVAKAISLASKNGMSEFSQDFLSKLESFTADEILDVYVYTAVAYTKILSRGHTVITQSQMEILANIYAYEEFILGEEDFSAVINKNILDILANEASKQTFSESTFQIFDCIFTSDDPYKKEALEIMKKYLTRKEIPKNTILAIENVLGKHEFASEALSTLEKVIENGQIVSVRTLKEFADKLFSADDREEVKNRSFTLLEFAERNQDLPDEIFEKVELERTGRLIELDVADFGEALKFLEIQTRAGQLLPENALKALKKQATNSKSLSILINVSANGQSLPVFLIDELTKAFDPTKQQSQLIEIFFNLEKNSQAIPPDLRSKLEAGLQEKTLSDETLLVFARWAQKSNEISKKVLEQIYEKFFTTKNQSLKQQFLSALCSAFEIQPYISQKRMEEVLKSGLQEENEQIIHISLDGFAFLVTKDDFNQDTVEALIQKAVHPACQKDFKERITLLLSSQPLKKSQSRLLELATLNCESESQHLRRLAELSKDGKLLDQNFQQINSILNGSVNLHGDVISMLERYPNIGDLPMYLIDSIAISMFRTSNEKFQNRCLSLIKKFVKSRKILSNDAMSLVCALKDINPGFLMEIKKKQEIPKDVDLIIQINSAADSIGTKKLRDLLEDIIKFDHELKITRTCLKKLVSLAEGRKEDVTLIAFASLFSRAILHDSQYINTSIAQIVERAISVRKIELIIVKAYGKLIQYEKCQRMLESLDLLVEFSLRKHVDEKDCWMLREVSSCLANAASLGDLREKCVDFMEINLTNSDVQVRRKCFQGLRARKEKGKNSKTFEIYCANLLQKLKAETRTQVKSDLDLLETLTSLEYWELGQLRLVPQDRWIRVLQIFDLLAHVKGNYDQKISLFQEWLDTENQLKSQKADPDKILKALVFGSTFTFKNLKQIFQFLRKVDLTKAENILLESQNPFQELKKQWLISLLTACLKNLSISKDYIDNLASNINLATPTISKLFDAISDVQTSTELESLINFAVKNKIQSDDIHLEKGSICILKKSLEIKLLMNQVRYSINRDKFAFILENLLNKGWEFEKLVQIFSKVESPTACEARVQEQSLLQVFKLLDDYEIPVTEYEKILEILSPNVEEWVKEINHIAIDRHFPPTGIKNHVELLSELININPQIASLLIQENLLEIKNQELTSFIDLSFVASSNSAEIQSPISKWTKDEISKWANIVKSDKSYSNNPRFLTEALAVIKRASSLHTRFDLTDSQILSCIVQLNANPEKGRLLQVGTGEGKSTIVSVLAIFHALKGKKVDIITSSPVLAERDAEEKTGLYKMFGLTCTDNSDKSLYTKGPKFCYKQDIVYGEIAQFQFDTLRDKYSMLGTLAGRECEIAIIDEVDCMLLDDGSNIARLSSTIAGMDLLQSFYHLIWDRLDLLQKSIILEDGKTYQLSNQIDESLNIQELKESFERLKMEGDIEKFFKGQLEKYLKEDIIESDQIPTPKNFKDFVGMQIPKWIESAIRALIMQEDRQYIIQDGVVKPVAYDSTGVVQGATIWSDGLHQFIQLKHRLKMTSETCTTNFLSNIGYIKKYGPNVYGLTGTLGSKKANEVLSDVYGVDLIIIPNLHKKRYLELPMVIWKNQEQWLEEVCDSAICEVNKERGVLIICQTIEHCHRVAQKMRQKYQAEAIKLYTMNNMNQERGIEKINSEEIIIATNLAGRGTDIKADNIENNGGLHVILTFLPCNQRVEDQAFGRTARQGKRGTGQMILNRADLFEFGNASLQGIKGIRDNFESGMLDEFLQNELERVNKKDELFTKFCNLKGEICKRIPTKMSFWQKIPYFESSVFEINMLNALEERWALFLHRIDDGKISLDRSHVEYSDFEKGIFEDFDKDELIKNPYNYIDIANDILSRRYVVSDAEYNEAAQYYNKAITLDPNCAAAFVGKAWLAIKKMEKFYQSKSQLREVLDKSLKLLNNEKITLLCLQKSLKQEDLNFESDLSKQLLEKNSIIGSFMNSVRNCCAVIKKSQRLIDIIGIKDYQTEAKCQRNDKIEIEKEDDSKGVVQVISNFCELERDEITSNVWRDIEDHNKFTVVFHDLTAFSDTRCQDQAVKTISNVFKSRKDPSENVVNRAYHFTKNLFQSSSILNPEIDKNLKITLNQLPYEILQTIFNHEIKILDVSKEMALVELKNNLPKCCRVDLYSVQEKVDENGERVVESKLNLTKKNALQTLQKKTDKNTRFSMKLKDVNEIPKLLKEEMRDSCLTWEYVELNREAALSKLARPKSDSLHLTLFGNANEILYALPNLDCCVQLKAGEDKIETIKINIAKDRIQNLRGTQIWIKMEKLNIEAAKQIIDACLETSFQLTFLQVNPFKALNDFEEELVNISFNNLSSTFAKKLIPLLRKDSLDFTLGFENLNFQQLKDVIANASLKQESLKITKVKKLSELYMENIRPNLELSEFSARGIEHMLEINEKNFIPWRSVTTLAALASFQVALGGVLIATGFGAASGIGLLTEGAADYITAYRAYRTRQFRWKSYAAMKAVSLAASAVSIGLGKIQDGLKGIESVAQGIKKEALEKAGNQVVRDTLTKAGAELNKLALQQIVVATSGAFAREGLNNLATSFFNFALEEFRPQISSFIQQKIETKFSQESFRILIGKMHALDKRQKSPYFFNQIQKIIHNIICPNNKHNHNAWDSVGGPLCRGILSDSRLIGSAFSIRTRILGTLSGLAQIAFMVESIFGQLIKKLSEIDNDSLSIHQLLHQICGIPREDAKKISEILKEKKIILVSEFEMPDQMSASISKIAKERPVAINTDYTLPLFNHATGLISEYRSPKTFQCEYVNPEMFETPQETRKNFFQKGANFVKNCRKSKAKKDLPEIDFGTHEINKKVQEFCEDLNKYAQTMNYRDLNETMKLMSDLITDQIIRVTESHLISPWSSYGIGMLTNNISAKIQDSLIRNKFESDSKSISENLEALEKKEEKTKEDLSLLVQHQSDLNELKEKAESVEKPQITYADLINYESDRYRTAYKNSENIYNNQQKQHIDSKISNEHKPDSKDVKSNPQIAEKENRLNEKHISEESAWWESLKDTLEGINTFVFWTTKIGECIIKVRGEDKSKLIVQFLSFANFVRISAITFDFTYDVIHSTEEIGVLPFDVLKNLLKNLAEKSPSFLDALSKIKAQCVEEIIPVLEEMKEPVQMLHEIEEFCKGGHHGEEKIDSYHTQLEDHLKNPLDSIIQSQRETDPLDKEESLLKDRDVGKNDAPSCDEDRWESYNCFDPSSHLEDENQKKDCCCNMKKVVHRSRLSLANSHAHNQE